MQQGSMVCAADLQSLTSNVYRQHEVAVGQNGGVQDTLRRVQRDTAGRLNPSHGYQCPSLTEAQQWPDTHWV